MSSFGALSCVGGIMCEPSKSSPSPEIALDSVK
jgi:hypothetical protein